jgi:zeta-carotene desaturase
VSKKRVLILGGGLSGLITAASLPKSEFTVTVLEQGMQAGGQVRGWEDEDGDSMETGIHVLFSWYINLVSIYERLGQPLPLVPTDGNFHVFNGPLKKISILETSTTLISTLRSLFTYPLLPFRDKLRFVKIVFDALTLTEKGAEKYDHWTVSAYLASRKAGPELTALLEISAVTIQALFGWEASAASFLKFTKCLFGSDTPLDASCFLSQPTHLCMVKPLIDVIEKNGGEVKLEEPINELVLEGDRVTEVKTPKEVYKDFDVVLSALPAYVFRKLLPGEIQQRFPALCSYQSAYVITLQMYYDRLVMDDGQCYISNRDGVLFDALIDKTHHWDELKGQGSVLQVLIDNAREYRNASDEMILDHVNKDLEVYFPKVKDAKLKKHHLQRHTQVFTETRPNYFSGVFRKSETFLSNLLVAGDWTARPYHYGMESAAVAGLRAANLLLERENLPPHEILDLKYPAMTEKIARWRCRKD